MSYFAHSGRLDDKSDWQLLRRHLRETADLAAGFASAFGLGRLAFITALLHDLGKYDPRFQERLAGKNIRVDHSTAGAALLHDLARGLDPYSRIMAELAAYAILGHHAGLPDRKNAEPSCFNRRIEGFTDNLDPIWKSEIEVDFAGIATDWLLPIVRPDNPHLDFDLSLVARMLFSCLVDADFKNTEAFYTELEKREVDRKWPLLQDLLPELRTRFDTHMEELSREGDLNKLRRNILSHVRGKAMLPPGLFTLTVPTGGGKTLASLGFALDHAAKHGHSRIIYSIPFTSIIDQTADIFRHVLGEDCVLEHHSAIEEDEAAERRRQRDFPKSRDRLKLAMEDWAAPVIVTTNVQFFESLFAAKTSRARKLHNIAGSIIVLDEARIETASKRLVAAISEWDGRVRGGVLRQCGWRAFRLHGAAGEQAGRPRFARRLLMVPVDRAAPRPMRSGAARTSSIPPTTKPTMVLRTQGPASSRGSGTRS